MSIRVGQPAPEIALYDDKKELFKLSSFKGSKNVILLFYPGAFTSVCTTELNTVNNDLAAYGADTVVVGISTDSPFAQAEFKKVNGLTFPLLSDHDAVASAAYGAKYDHNFTPMKLDRIAKRSAFVVAKDGTIAYAEVLENAGEMPDLDAVKKAVNG
ncbi:MAG: redoxin domain-containing protein [Rhodothermales bacterium]